MARAITRGSRDVDDEAKESIEDREREKLLTVDEKPPINLVKLSISQLKLISCTFKIARDLFVL